LGLTRLQYNIDEMKNDEFINQYIALVKSIAGKYNKSGVPFGDLVQEGLLGLLHAKKNYNSKQNTLFSTYAYPWIHKRIREYAKKESTRGFAELDENILENTPEQASPGTDETGINLPDSLNQIEKTILKHLFEDRMPLDKIALLLGLKRERVRQIKQKALRKMKINNNLTQSLYPLKTGTV